MFDLALISIPLFLIDAPGAGVQRGLVIAAALVPIAVVALRYAQAGQWTNLPASLRNGAWTTPQPLAVAERVATLGTIGPYASLLQRALPVLGIAGIAAWLAFAPLRADVPAVAIDRDAAVAAAQSALADRGVVLGAEWIRMAIPRSALEDATERLWHAFVWREAGPRAYRALVGNALAPPSWEVRFARFEGDVAERAEEWRVIVQGDGRIWQIAHRLPEGRPGATLTRDEAQSMAERTLHRQGASDAGALLLRGADQAQRPKRRDWIFAYADPRIDVGKSGEARVRVAIAGDEVVATDRSLFVPEAWQRAEIERVGRRDLVRTVALGIIASAIIVALVFAVHAWSKGRSDRRALIGVAVLLFVMVIASSANNWPMRAFSLRTAEPVASQILVSVLAMAAGGALMALLVGLLAGVGVHYARREVPVPLAGRFPAWACGVMAALATAGIAAALAALVPASLPSWPDMKPMAAAWPAAAAALFGLSLIPVLALTLLLLSLIDRATVGWTRRLPLLAFALVAIGVAASVLSGHELWQAIPHGAIEGATAFTFAWLLLRYDLRAVPAFVATGLTLEALRAAFLAATPSGWLSFAVTVAVVALLTWWTTRRMARAPDSLQQA